MNKQSSIGLSVHMLKTCSILTLLLISTALIGCQNASIVMKPDVMTTYADDDTSSGEFTEEQSLFTSEDKHVIAWASFSQAHGERIARFKWYNPSGHLVLDSEDIKVSPDDQLYDWRGVWSVMPLKDTSASLMTGTWKVFVFLDGKKIGTIKFDVRP